MVAVCGKKSSEKQRKIGMKDDRLVLLQERHIQKIWHLFVKLLVRKYFFLFQELVHRVVILKKL
jgi:starvation-inducible outer membrane lipoprotein